jgi:hypothetical protein
MVVDESKERPAPPALARRAPLAKQFLRQMARAAYPAKPEQHLLDGPGSVRI